MADKELKVKVRSDFKDYQKDLKEAEKNTSKFGSVIKKTTQLIKVGFAGVAGAVTGATLRFASFEKDFTAVVNLLNKDSFGDLPLEQGVENLKQEIIGLRAETGESFATLNKAYFDYISATGDAIGATEAVRVATDLASAGVTSAAVAIDGITTSMNAYSKELTSAEETSALLFAAQVQGKTTIEELSSSIGKAAPIASALGVSYKELLSATSALTLQGISTREAMTGLKAAFSNVVKPTADAALEAERLGIRFDQTGLKADGLQVFLQKIIKASDGNKESLTRLFGSVEAVNSVFALTSEGGAKFNSILETLNDTQEVNATFTNATAKANETLSKTLDKLTGRFDSLLVNIGNKLKPFIQQFSDGVEILSMKFSKQEDILQGTAGAFTKTRLAIIDNIEAQDELKAKLEEANVFTKLYYQNRLDNLKEEEIALREKAAVLEQTLAQEQAVKDADLEQDQERKEIQNELKLENDLLKQEAEQEHKTALQLIEEGHEVAISELQSQYDNIRNSKDKNKKKDELKRLQEHIAQQQGITVEDLAFKTKILDEFQKQKEAKQVAARTRFIKQEKEFGTTVATIDKFLNDERVKSSASASSQLIALQNSKNKELKQIGKVAALVDISINTARGAIAAYQSLAPIPFVGPALGAVAAAALTAFGLEQARQVKAAKNGTIVTSGINGNTDTEPYMLAKGEMVVPAELTPTAIQTFENLAKIKESGASNIVNNNDFEDNIDQQPIQVEIEFKGDAAQLLQAKINENSQLNI